MSGPAETALRDQVDAAAADAAGRVDGLAARAARLGIPARVLRGSGAAPRWVVEATARWVAVTEAAGVFHHCGHVDLAAPQPMVAVVWAPGYLACGQCSYRLPVLAERENVCDGCGRLVDHQDLMVWTVGYVLLHAGVCRSCQRRAATCPSSRRTRRGKRKPR